MGETEDDHIRKVAREAAHEVVAERLQGIGIEVNDSHGREQVRRQMDLLQMLAQAKTLGGKAALWGIVVAFASGFGAMIWQVIKGAIKGH